MQLELEHTSGSCPLFMTTCRTSPEANELEIGYYIPLSFFMIFMKIIFCKKLLRIPEPEDIISAMLC
jgi:hypothetical protein